MILSAFHFDFILVFVEASEVSIKIFFIWEFKLKVLFYALGLYYLNDPNVFVKYIFNSFLYIIFFLHSRY